MSAERTETARRVRGIVRQGDVLLVPVDEVPVRQRRREIEGPRIVVAEGEATGHAHVVRGEARLVRSTAHYFRPTEQHLVVTGAAVLTHEEHDTIELAPGTYEVRRQREYVPGGRIRRLAD